MLGDKVAFPVNKCMVFIQTAHGIASGKIKNQFFLDILHKWFEIRSKKSCHWNASKTKIQQFRIQYVYATNRHYLKACNLCNLCLREVPTKTSCTAQVLYTDYLAHELHAYTNSSLSLSSCKTNLAFKCAPLIQTMHNTRSQFMHIMLNSSTYTYVRWFSSQTHMVQLHI